MNIWKNKKTGCLYEIVDDNVKCANNSCTDIRHVLYRNQDGEKFVREFAEFNDKFVLTYEHSLYLVKQDQMRDCKMVIAVRKDLNMPVGKIASQVAHAAMGAVFNKGVWKDNNTFSIGNLTEAEKSWMMFKFTKITLWCDDNQHMQMLEDKSKRLGVNCRTIIDAGDTIFNGQPTPTCIAIGPDWSEKINEITGGLKLLR